MPDATIVDLMRHGEPVGGRKYRGQLDDPLSTSGWREMWQALDNQAPWDRIFTSSLSRCCEFADRLGAKHSIPVTQDLRLKEVGFGEWEGKTSAEINQDDPLVLSRFYNDPVHNRPPGAELLETFRERVEAAFYEILEMQQGKHILIVTHAGVIRVIMALVLQAPLTTMYRISVATASLTRVQANNERPLTLLFHGRHHLC